ncbi:MAG: bifunctional hydroxymethylpyrimidine kinase/phosphomethylpyrimidine kinase [Novosphingobium sp.]
MTKLPRVLVIAGSDSSGGAGIQADIKTITMLGGYAMTAITAITAQNTAGVSAVEVLSPELVIAQINACVNDIGVNAVKIGMLGSAEIAHTVADLLAGADVPVVFDPVMIATSGSALADSATIAAFERLMALATLTTPNLPELRALGGQDLVRTKTRNLLIKGGHGTSSRIEDVLFVNGDEYSGKPGEYSFWSERIDTIHTHGTGCSLASAIAVGLAEAMWLHEAVDRGIAFVQQALKNAPCFGDGHGPIGHTLGRVPFYEALAAINTDGWDAAAFAAKWS